MIKMTNIQYRWLRWLLLNLHQMNWLGKHIEAPENYERLRNAYRNREYDVATRALLNFLLKKFNEDEDMLDRWNKTREWDRAQGMR